MTVIVTSAHRHSSRATLSAFTEQRPARPRPPGASDPPRTFRSSRRSPGARCGSTRRVAPRARRAARDSPAGPAGRGPYSEIRPLAVEKIGLRRPPQPATLPPVARVDEGDHGGGVCVRCGAERLHRGSHTASSPSQSRVRLLLFTLAVRPVESRCEDMPPLQRHGTRRARRLPCRRRGAAGPVDRHDAPCALDRRAVMSWLRGPAGGSGRRPLPASAVTSGLARGPRCQVAGG